MSRRMKSKRIVYKNCPFCGGKARRNDKLTEGVEGVVECKECGACAFVTDWEQRVARRAKKPATK